MTAWNKTKIFTALETKSGIIAELDQFVIQPDNIEMHC